MLALVLAAVTGISPEVSKSSDRLLWPFANPVYSIWNTHPPRLPLRHQAGMLGM